MVGEMFVGADGALAGGLPECVSDGVFDDVAGSSVS